MSKNCSGLHCPGCGHGGGAGLVVAVLVVLAVLAGSGRALERAALEVAYIAAGAAGVTLAAGTVAAVVMIRKRSRHVLPGPGAPRELPTLTGRVLPPAAARPELDRPRPSLRAAGARDRRYTR